MWTTTRQDMNNTLGAEPLRTPCFSGYSGYSTTRGNFGTYTFWFTMKAGLTQGLWQMSVLVKSMLMPCMLLATGPRTASFGQECTQTNTGMSMILSWQLFHLHSLKKTHNVTFRWMSLSSVQYCSSFSCCEHTEQQER